MIVAKSLYWRKATDHPQDSGQWVADGIGGRYSAEKQRDGSWLLWWAHDNFIWEACATFAEVKEKAEVDWQKRFADRVRTGPCIEDGGFVGMAITTHVQEASTAPSDSDTRRMAETGTGSVRSTSSAGGVAASPDHSPKDQTHG